MSKTPTPEPTDKRHFVNRNETIKTVAKIADLLEGFDRERQMAILRFVEDVIGIKQPELEFPNGSTE